jgi:hypothetical protein
MAESGIRDGLKQQKENRQRYKEAEERDGMDHWISGAT